MVNVDRPLLVPEMARVQAVRELTEDTRLFEVVGEDGGAPVSYQVGQFYELSVLGIGECPISITSAPTRPDHLEFAAEDRPVGR